VRGAARLGVLPPPPSGRARAPQVLRDAERGCHLRRAGPYTSRCGCPPPSPCAPPAALPVPLYSAPAPSFSTLRVRLWGGSESGHDDPFLWLEPTWKTQILIDPTKPLCDSNPPVPPSGALALLCPQPLTRMRPRANCPAHVRSVRAALHARVNTNLSVPARMPPPYTVQDPRW